MTMRGKMISMGIPGQFSWGPCLGHACVSLLACTITFYLLGFTLQDIHTWDISQQWYDMFGYE